MLKIHHYAMEVADIEKVRDFYINLLGFSEGEKIELAGEKIVFLRNGEAGLELIHRSEEEAMPETVHLCFETTSIQTIVEKFAESGIKAAEGPFTLKNGWKTVFFKGAANELIEFLEP